MFIHKYPNLFKTLRMSLVQIFLRLCQAKYYDAEATIFACFRQRHFLAKIYMYVCVARQAGTPLRSRWSGRQQVSALAHLMRTRPPHIIGHKSFCGQFSNAASTFSINIYTHTYTRVHTLCLLIEM